MSVFVFRINYNEDFQKVRQEILQGRLHQGWGADGMRIDVEEKDFLKAWNKVWTNDGSDSEKSRRYRNLRIMLEIKPDDLIIVPKVSLRKEKNNPCRSFSILKCVKPYDFKIPDGWDDFGNFITVRPLFSCPYNANNEARIISTKFKAYQSPINHVWNNDFIEAVGVLISLFKKDPDAIANPNTSLIDHLNTATKKTRDEYLNDIVKQMVKWDSHTFEDIIAKLFEKNGYAVIAKNQHEDGGDIDIVLSAVQNNSLLDAISNINTGNAIFPRICIQAKKKEGTDADDLHGVKQLILMKDKEEYQNSIFIVINSEKEFSNEAKEKAGKANIILLNGYQFANLLVRYDVELGL